MSDSLWPLELQHVSLPYPSLSPRVCSRLCLLNKLCGMGSVPVTGLDFRMRQWTQSLQTPRFPRLFVTWQSVSSTLLFNKCINPLTWGTKAAISQVRTLRLREAKCYPFRACKGHLDTGCGTPEPIPESTRLLVTSHIWSGFGRSRHLLGFCYKLPRAHLRTGLVMRSHDST